jgi:hypothetical protein
MVPELKNFAYSFNELNITVGLVEEAMGYGYGQSPDPFPSLIALALLECETISAVKGSLFVSDHFSADTDGNLDIDGICFSIGKKIAKQLRKAEGGALFICTAGAGIGEKSKELMAEGNLLEGYFLDVIGSVTVEAAIDKIQDNFEYELMNSGYKLANRYSPGYCGWALKEQEKIFNFFPANHCGISLSDSFLMNPIKSVSGVLGFGTNIKKLAYECQLCELETCVYRKIRLAKGK